MIKFIKAGYAGRNSLSGITAEAALSLNVMNIAFGHVADSRIVFDCGCAEDIDRIKTLNPEIKILLSVGGWGSGGFSPMASAPETRHKFAGSAGKILTECGLDGIDLDWEYPCIDTAGIEASPDDKFNFTLLLAALREELDTKKINSGNRPMMTIAAGAGDYYIKNTQIDLIAPMVDYISVMTYDMRGSWSYTTGHHTNLFKPQNSETDPESAEHSVGLFISAGVPRKKIVIGSAFYSRKWEKVKNENNGYLQPSEGTGGYGPDYTDLYKNYINKNGFKRYWDDIAKAPYLFDGNTFISYDDEQSVAEKCDYIRDNGLLGIMYWEHACDQTGQLLGVINNML